MSKKAILNKKIIIIVIALFVIGLCFSIFNFFKNFQGAREESLSEKPVDVIKEDDLVEEDHYQRREDLEFLGDKDGDIFTQESYQNLILHVEQSYLRHGKIKEANDHVYGALNRRNTKGEYGAKVEDLLADLSILLLLDNDHIPSIENIYNGIRTPEVLFYAIINAPIEIRNQVILSQDSLSPICYSPASILELEKDVDLITSHIPGAEYSYSVKFYCDEYPLTFYMIRKSDNTLIPHSLQYSDPNNIGYYMTVKRWKELLGEVERNLNYRKNQ